MSGFRFKQFEVYQSRSAMKVGSDSVILGAWCSVTGPFNFDCPADFSSDCRSDLPLGCSSDCEQISKLAVTIETAFGLGLQPSEAASEQLNYQSTICHVLDVGAGTGLLALMVAQRSQRAVVDAIEIDSESCLDAALNFANSPWGDRLRLHHKSFQEFTVSLHELAAHPDGLDSDHHDKKLYDHIISNPPYFIDSLKSPSAARTAARHSDTLSYDDLISCSLEILTPHGTLAVILPHKESEVFNQIATDRGLYCNRRLAVHSTPTSGIRRVAMEFSRIQSACVETTLIIENAFRHDYSEEYKLLTKDFYLKF